jgi:hypothetical protein
MERSSFLPVIAGIALAAAVSEAAPRRYRPFIATKDRTRAVMFVPPEHDSGTPSDASDADTVDVAVAVAYSLSKMGVKVLWVNDRARSAGMEKLKAMGADMSFVEHVVTPQPYRNPYIRDYAPFMLMDRETGGWSAVRLDRRKSDRSEESWLGDWLEKTYRIPVVGVVPVKDTRDSGGNVLMDEQGRCFSAGKTHPLFKSLIRCSRTVTMPCWSEVCHVDEYLTFLKDETAVTNKEKLVPVLRRAGYKNILRVPDDPDLSFANVLIIGDTIFLMYIPSLQAEMEKARSVYESQGYRVIPVRSNSASAKNGALHCLTKEIPAF